MKRVITGSFGELEKNLEKIIAGERRNQRFPAPIVVITPTYTVRMYLKRLLSSRFKSLFNVSFYTFKEFSELIIESQPDCRNAPLPDFLQEFLLHTIARENSTNQYFAGICNSKGFARVLQSTLMDFKAAGITPEILQNTLIKGSDSSEKFSELLEIYKRYQQTIESHGFYDKGDLPLQAALSVKNNGFIEACSHLCIYGFYKFNFGERRLLESLFEKKITVLLPYLDIPIFRPIKDLLRWFQACNFGISRSLSLASPECNGLKKLHASVFSDEFEDSNVTESTVYKGVKFICAPGESIEAQELMRNILVEQTQTTGNHFGLTGLVFPPESNYKYCIQNMLQSQKISFYEPQKKLAETPEAEILIKLVDVFSRNFARHTIIALAESKELDYAHIISPGLWEGFAVELWEKLAHKLNIYYGLDQWLMLLGRFIERLESQKEEDQEFDHKNTHTAVLALQEFLLFFKKSWEQINAQANYRTLLQTFLEIFYTLCRDSSKNEIIRIALAPIAYLDNFVEQVNLETFRDCLLKILQDTPYSDGQTNDSSLFVCQSEDALGLSFAVLALPGMTDRLLPAQNPKNSMLTDQERSYLNGLLNRAGFNQNLMPRNESAEEKLRFQLLIGSVHKKLLLSFSRFMLSSGT